MQYICYHPLVYWTQSHYKSFYPLITLFDYWGQFS